MDLVMVAGAVPVAGEVSGPLELAHDAVGGSLGDADARGDVSQAHVRIPGHAKKDVGMVCEEAPTGHRLHDIYFMFSMSS